MRIQLSKTLRRFLPMRTLAYGAIGLLCASGPSSALALVFAVNEGVTYQVARDDMVARYASIASGLSKLLKLPVTVEPVMDYTALRKGLADKRYDLALVHPAHVAMEAMKRSGYHLVVVARGFESYSAQFLVRADSSAKTLADLKGGTVVAPDADSITSVMMRAALHEAGLREGDVKLSYTRFQDAVPFYLDNGFAQVGATASGAVVKAWTAKGGRVLVKSRAVPIKDVLASPSMSAEQIKLVREFLLALETTEDGRARLEPSKLLGFSRFEEAAFTEIGDWLIR